MTAELILLVDDEASIINLARLYLEREGYLIQSVGDGLSAMRAVQELRPDLMVLDIMLPELDGLEVCRRLRSENNQLAIIMLTARDEDIDKILGLELGADDYLTKPFNPRELVSRVKAVLRRSERMDNLDVEVIRVADLVIDSGSREVTCKDQSIELRTQEFEVLMVLARNKGLVLSREKLLQLAWGYDYYGQTRTVDVHIAQLRRKLSDCSVQIHTVPGIGYKLAA